MSRFSFRMWILLVKTTFMTEWGVLLKLNFWQHWYGTRIQLSIIGRVNFLSSSLVVHWFFSFHTFHLLRHAFEFFTHSPCSGHLSSFIPWIGEGKTFTPEIAESPYYDWLKNIAKQLFFKNSLKTVGQHKTWSNWSNMYIDFDGLHKVWINITKCIILRNPNPITMPC